MCEVTETHDDHIMCTVKNDYQITNRMKMSLPGAQLEVPTITDQDQTEIEEFGLKNGLQKPMDYICISFVRKPTDVETVKILLQGQKTKVISKIQTYEALHNFEEILKLSDGIMIARTDLGMEL